MRFLYSLIVCSSMLCLSENLMAQEPFNVPMVDPPGSYKFIDYEHSTAGEIKYKSKQTSDIKNNVSSFTQASVGFLASGDLSSTITPSLNLNVIQYRLGIYTRYDTTDKANAKIDTARVYLPFAILSKISTKYDTTLLTTIDDITSFGGSPLTVRLMPNYSFRVGEENSITVGHISDMRALVYHDKILNQLITKFGYYASVGLKFGGLGEVRDEAGQTYLGSWSISALAYTFLTDHNSKMILFGDPNAPVNGFEFIFKFVASKSELTRFNIFASIQRENVGPNLPSPWIIKLNFGN